MAATTFSHSLHCISRVFPRTLKTRKQGVQKNKAHWACLGLRPLVIWTNMRLWSVHTINDYLAPSNEWHHSYSTSLTANSSRLPMSYVGSADNKRRKKNVQRWIKLSKEPCWDSTAWYLWQKHPLQQLPVESGWIRTGADKNMTFRWENTDSVSGTMWSSA